MTRKRRSRETLAGDWEATKTEMAVLMSML